MCVSKTTFFTFVNYFNGNRRVGRRACSLIDRSSIAFGSDLKIIVTSWIFRECNHHFIFFGVKVYIGLGRYDIPDMFCHTVYRTENHEMTKFHTDMSLHYV